MNTEAMLEDVQKKAENNSLIKDFNIFIEKENQIKHELKEHNENTIRQLENKNKSSQESNLLGNLVEISYETATLITNDYFTFNNGGVPKSSFLIATLNNFSYNTQNIPEHFILLQVQETTGTPASPEMRQTYYSWIKKANPELDDFTKDDLAWNALKCKIKGMFYKNIDGFFEYSADLNILFSPLHYVVYKPNTQLLNIILNSEFLNKKEKSLTTKYPINLIKLGYYRAIENKLLINHKENEKVEVFAQLEDFLGRRTAMFGKTRLGKSNTVKLIIKNILNLTIEKPEQENTYTVGQLIFDVNGEYAFENEKDKTSIYKMFPGRCEVYTLNPNKVEKYKELKINFYENPQAGIQILKELLTQSGENAHYVKGFMNLEIPSPQDIVNLGHEEKLRPLRKLFFYWAILRKAGFLLDQEREKNLLASIGMNNFDLKFNNEVIKKIWDDGTLPHNGKILEDLKYDVAKIAEYIKAFGANELKSSSKKRFYFIIHIKKIFTLKVNKKI